MTPVGPGPRPRRAQRPLQRWCNRTAAELGVVPSDWHDDLGPKLIAAICSGDDTIAVLHRFVRRRVSDGWGLRVIMSDLERLRRSLALRHRWSRRWRELRVEAAAAYADEVIDDLFLTTGRDALSGLPNHAYLAVHLEELVAATDPDDAHRAQLVVIAVHGRSASVTDRMSLRIQVARALGDAVPPGVLVAQVRHERFVLVLPTLIPYEAVRPAIDRALRHVSVVDSVVVGTTPLPRTRAELASLVGRWWHQRPLDHP